VVARELRAAGGRRLLALAQRLERSPAELMRARTQSPGPSSDGSSGFSDSASRI
jgi:hypothetical protein